jgi:hypothetical protein
VPVETTPRSVAAIACAVRSIVVVEPMWMAYVLVPLSSVVLLNDVLAEIRVISEPS